MRTALRVPRSVFRLVAALGVAILLVIPALAHADVLDDGVRRIALQLQCPVCEGQSAADSPSGLAADMRAVIRTKLTEGESDQQILDYFVARYGDSILTEPPKRGISLGVWLGPLVGVPLGLIALVLVLRTWRGRPSPVTPTSDDVLDPDVAAEFNRFRQEVSR
jgi:cytochrome c-type biogenesis protein CcmH